MSNKSKYILHVTEENRGVYAIKLFSFSLFLVVSLTLGCAHSPSLNSSVSPSGALSQDQAQETSIISQNEKINTGEYGDYVEEGEKEKKVGIADPLEPFNRAMYHFNDKLYFWALKPVAQGYRKVVPEGARVSVSNFFSNLAAPIRSVNCLLQANFSGAASEFGRFVVNTIWGIGGLMDPASSKDIDLSKHEEDFGQTLGVYGLGQGFYINWPIFGPSSPRDTVGMVGDLFLRPLTYVNPWEVSVGTRAYDKVNDTSLRIGDYESLKEAAIDPYIAIRDAYVQHRMHKVKERGPNKAPTSPGSGN